MNTPPAITHLSMVILMQHDLDAAVAFYSDLGMQLKFRMKGTWAEFELNGIKIGLCQHGTAPVENRTGIVLQVNDLEQFFQKYKEHLTFIAKPIEAAHGIMTSIQDPGGNIIDLYQPTPEKLQEIMAKQKNEGCCKTDVVSCCKEVKQTSCC